MTSPLRVSLVQVGYGDDESMGERIDRVVGLLDDLPDADLVVLPELWAHGGFASDTWAEQAETIGGGDGGVVQRLAELVRRRRWWLHGGSIIERAAADADPGPDGRGLWNTSLVFDPDGVLRTTYRKIHRFGFGDGEPRLLEAGESLAVTEAAFGSGTATVGLATCYDLRFPELFRGLGELGAGLVVVPAAWPLPRVEHWRLLGRARALENQTWVIQCNTAGSHRGLTMGGHSQVVAPTGDVVAELGPDADVLTVEIDLDLVAETRAAFPVLADRRLGARA